MVAVIALGICVDDTLHFMTRYHNRSQNRNDPDGALRDTVIDESVPIFTTSFALMLGFLTFAWSSFVPITYFGLLSAMVMLLALITTFVITPLLLHYIHLVTMWDMLSLQLQAKVINSCTLFKGMTSWSIKKTILSSEVQDYAPGQKIISQGSIGDKMYVILEGQVDVKITQDDGSVITVNQMTEGELFGEIALVSRVPRTANVVSGSNSRLLALQWESIEKLSRFHTRTAMKIFNNLASIVGRKLSHVKNISALRDEASGCLNRSMVKEIIHLELLKAKRYKEPISFISFTLQSPLANDVFDLMLGELSRQVCNDIRNVDILARWNEQRFIVLLPRTTEQDCHQLIIGRIEKHLSVALAHYGHSPLNNVRIWAYDGLMPLEIIRDKTTGILDAPLHQG
jgi:CRP-like cAMP-binding protein